ncbi:hypothetical protein V6N11_042047 [Hibiscus sabdariffa]
MGASSGNDDNGFNGPDASASDGHEGVHFGWSDELVDEDNGEFGWLENENENRNAETENEANKNGPAESGVNEKEADENEENEADGADESDTEENEASSVDLSTGEKIDYLVSSDVRSYETDEDGDFVSRKTSKFKNALYAYAVAHRFDFLFVCNRKEKG